MANQEKKDYKTQIKTFLSDWVGVAKKKWWIYLVELAVVAIILVADLLSKQAAWEYLENYGVKELIPHLFNLVMVKNMGAGFGIFQGKTIALTVVTFIVVICICVYLFFALVFVTAGGIGNIVDRIALGYVRDFIQFAFWESFPVFNVADSFVTVGAFMLVVVLIVMLVKEGKKNQKEFEEEQKGIADNQEQSDPLDAPVNLNPKMKTQNDYTFVVSEQKEENKAQETAEKQPENDEKSQEFENSSDNNEKTDESNESK